MQNRISIAMATYNGEAYIREQLDSFLTQAAMPDEIVISDDCSSDTTVCIANAFLKGKSVDFVLEQNSTTLGYAQNFNNALGVTSGDIIFLSDQDDVWLEAKIDVIRQAFDRNPDKYLIIHDLEYCDQHLKLTGQTKLERLKSIGANDRSYVTGMATAIRKEFLNVCLPIPNNPLITHDLWLHECAYFLDIKTVIPDVLALYRRHDKTVTVSSAINKSSRISFCSFIKFGTLNSVKIAVDRKIATLTAVLNWLDSPVVLNFYTTSVIGNQVDYEKIRVKVKIELSHAEKRRALLDKPISERVFYGIMLYIQGGYKQFLGKKSLFKDIFMEK